MLSFRARRTLSDEWCEAPGVSEAFKREAVERVWSSRLSVVAGELGLHDTVLRKWARQFGVGT